MKDGLKVLIIGGYGIFGGRLVDLLQDEPRLTIIVAGRSLDKANSFCQTRTAAKAKLVPAVIDRSGDLATDLALLQPDILVDASGPFQAYGGKQYGVIEACIAQRVHYLDLADGADFVAGVSRFDEAAKTVGLYILSGVSSFPVLTAAVVRRLSSGMNRVDTIYGGIAPSPYAGVGENVIRAIASYAGQRITMRCNGKSVKAYPLTQHKRYTVAPPGHVPLRNIMFSLVDVPDLRALPALWPEVKTIWMGAGPVPEVLHRALAALSWLVRIRLLPSLAPLAPLMHFVMNHLRWGEHRGGMFVEVGGVDAATMPVTRSWHLLAEGNDGPYIPSMAVEALVRRALAGKIPSFGARAALHDLELEDYEALFANRTIYTGTRGSITPTACLYEKILGSAWAELPSQISAMHRDVSIAVGSASVERGQGLLARLIASAIGFPKSAVDTPVTVRFTASNQIETWKRTFGAQSFLSRQFAGKGKSDGLLCERFGPLTFAMALILDGQKLSLVLRRWQVFGISLPMWLCPTSTAYETIVDDKFHFYVSISHKFTGLIVCYRGWLMPQVESL